MARIALYDRQTALDKAVVLFWQRGYYNASIKQIEHALDMRPGSIYAAFGSKDGLFLEALACYAKESSDQLSSHLAKYSSIIDGLQDYLREIALACQPGGPIPSRACMVVKTLLETSNTHLPINQEVNRVLDAIEHRLGEVLEQAKSNGELKPDVDCKRLARLLQAQIIGLRSFAQRETCAPNVVELGEDMAGILDHYRL
ncbi:TetR/AcrR family transcriptional regulator [Marinobacter changyiensis]|uniref:TetR/AcrR family transcriptional regulator n=1 Tax=Marinobacter changyiensis TaxID=2604091 RepID=UPI0012641F1B|nr:TetR/AcrR family transcriptional regulator [Marinobacter changyiensis]